MIESNIGEIRERIRRLQNWPEVAKGIVESHVNVIVDSAKDIVPVDTGKLRQSIVNAGTKMVNDIISGSVKAGTHYASYVEYGTVYMDPQPYLGPALQRDIDNLLRDLIESFNALV